MDTKELLIELWDLKTKSDIEALINSELDKLITYFNSNGYSVEKENGFVGKQSLNNNSDLFKYQSFRDFHFIYWGLKGNWDTIDINENIYYEKLKGVIESIYNVAKSI